MTRFPAPRLFASERGAAIIELALVAPFLALLMIGVVVLNERLNIVKVFAATVTTSGALLVKLSR